VHDEDSGVAGGCMSAEETSALLERRRASRWTIVHPIFALGQLLVFCVSVALLVAYLRGAVPFWVVHLSVLTKIGLMVGAVVTGSLWEHDMYGYWWFAPAFMVEDVMTLIVFITQLGYLLMQALHPQSMPAVLTMLVLAYTIYLANVAQYIHKTQRVKHDTRALAHGDLKLAA